MTRVKNIGLDDFLRDDVIQPANYASVILFADSDYMRVEEYSDKIELARKKFDLFKYAGQWTVMDDIDDNTVGDPENSFIVPQKVDVETINCFLELHSDKNVLAVCTAGISRSAFVRFLADMKAKRYDEWEAHDGYYTGHYRSGIPNVLMIKHAVDLGIISEDDLNAIQSAN